jgi:predicted HTH domain antitoxin
LTISEERKKRVIDLYYNQGKTTREIAKLERMSIRDISAILKEEEARRQKYKDQQQQEELSSKAYELFSEGKRPVEVDACCAVPTIAIHNPPAIIVPIIASIFLIFLLPIS